MKVHGEKINHSKLPLTIRYRDLIEEQLSISGASFSDDLYKESDNGR